MRIVVCTGGFDPLHRGHIAYLKAASELGHSLVVGLNSNEWLERKKGKYFLSFEDRQAIVQELACVDEAVGFDDTDGSARSLLLELKKNYPRYTIIFANGGDRTSTNIPEMDIEGIEFAFGVGGEDKKNSSRWILEAWTTETE